MSTCLPTSFISPDSKHQILTLQTTQLKRCGEVGTRFTIRALDICQSKNQICCHDLLSVQSLWTLRNIAQDGTLFDKLHSNWKMRTQPASEVLMRRLRMVINSQFFVGPGMMIKMTSYLGSLWKQDEEIIMCALTVFRRTPWVMVVHWHD